MGNTRRKKTFSAVFAVAAFSISTVFFTASPTVVLARDAGPGESASQFQADVSQLGAALGDFGIAEQFKNLVLGGFQRLEASAYTAALTALSAITDWIAYAVVSLIHGIAVIASYILEASATISTFSMGKFGQVWDVVRRAWQVIRDLGNTLFVFALLYAAFNTVLGLKNGAREMLPRIIIVALLVNFSYLFSVTMIDMSNTLAATVFDELKGGTTDSLGSRFVKAGGIESFVSAEGLSGKVSSAAGGIFGFLGGLSGFKSAVVDGQIANSTLAMFQTSLARILGGIFVLILAFFFLAIAFTLLARFVMLVMLTALSAGAFVAYIFPALESHTKKWWSLFVSQALYAPAVFLMLLLVLGVQSEISRNIGVIVQNTQGGIGTASFAVASTALAEVLKFILLMFFLGAAMKLSKLLADRGGKLAVNLGQRAQRAAGSLAMGGAGAAMRGSFGRLGAWAGKNQGLQAMSAKGGWRGFVGNRLLGVAGRAEKASFDIRGTGAAQLLAKQTGMDFGKVSKEAAGGWSGVEKKRLEDQNKRLEQAKKWDLSAGDKKEKLKEVITGAARGTKLGDAEAAHERAKKSLEDAEKQLERAKTMGASAAVIAGHEKVVADRKISLESVAKDRDELAWHALNKQMFGIEDSGKHHNFSSVMAQSMRRDALRMGTLKSMGLLGAGGLGMLMGGPALAAGGLLAALGSGRAVSGLMRGLAFKTPVGQILPRLGGSRGKYKLADGVTEKDAGFWQVLGANQAKLAASAKVTKAIDRYAKAKDELAAVNRRIDEEVLKIGHATESLKDEKKAAEKEMREAGKAIKAPEEKKEKGGGGEKKKDGGGDADGDDD